MELQETLKATFGDRVLQTRADKLVNPASGLANDYLNHFNEVVMIIEQLPTMPDLIEDLFAWRPISYDDYFALSSLPGRHAARDAYAKLDTQFRREFEDVVADLDRLATGSLAALRRHLKSDARHDPVKLSEICNRAGRAIRAVLEKAAGLVNSGSAAADLKAQERADRLLAIRRFALRDINDFVNRPRYAQD
ncbi:MAG: hypothetical protein K2X62_06920 [Beijerinckiaceae bacterium]|nr:hypothetical protein [Beijerinckiaceae bacterium]MDO9443405.1 hypothetical protein [Beijerinckiaceae bacterium]